MKKENTLERAARLSKERDRLDALKERVYIAPKKFKVVYSVCESGVVTKN